MLPFGFLFDYLYDLYFIAFLFLGSLWIVVDIFALGKFCFVFFSHLAFLCLFALGFSFGSEDMNGGDLNKSFPC